MNGVMILRALTGLLLVAVVIGAEALERNSASDRVA
jgi:hypothetical protein